VDPARQSAVVGAVLGMAVVVLGAVIVAIGLGVIPATLRAPPEVVVTAGVGTVFCGAAFAMVTRNPALARLLGIFGAVLAFVVPLAWLRMLA
jgi:hypothetical protein